MRSNRCWYWHGLWQLGHRLCAQPGLEAAALLVRYLGLCPLRDNGSALSHDGVHVALRFLNRHLHLIAIVIIIIIITATITLLFERVN